MPRWMLRHMHSTIISTDMNMLMNMTMATRRIPSIPSMHIITTTPVTMGIRTAVSLAAHMIMGMQRTRMHRMITVITSITMGKATRTALLSRSPLR
jgi:hypothetical protein